MSWVVALDRSGKPLVRRDHPESDPVCWELHHAQIFIPRHYYALPVCGLTPGLRRTDAAGVALAHARDMTDAPCRLQ